MGLSKGVGQGKWGSGPPCKANPPTNPQCHNAESGGSQGQVTGQSRGKGTGDTHERVKLRKKLVPCKFVVAIHEHYVTLFT